MTNTKAADDVSSTTDTFSDDDGPKCAMLTRDEMIRMSKANGEIIGSVSDTASAIVFFH
jgi:hypothetical protein